MAKGVWRWSWLETRHKAAITAGLSKPSPGGNLCTQRSAVVNLTRDNPAKERHEPVAQVLGLFSNLSFPLLK